MSWERDEHLPLDVSMMGKGPIWVPGDNRLALVHSDAYAKWAFSSTHPTQGRRFMKARQRLLDLAPEAEVEVIEIESDLLPDLKELARVHDPRYVEQVMLDGECGEWSGTRRDLSALALRMAGGTLKAARALLDGTAHTAVHFAGAKHHAMRDRSSGFCVFNDFALTATWLLDSKVKVYSPWSMRWKPLERIAILDIDAHHGDGTEALLRDDDRVQTFSVHDRSIFPGTGHHDDEGRHVFNWPLEAGSGDSDLENAVSQFIGVGQLFDPDMIFIAIGADGHETDPLSSLTYSVDGMVEALRLVRRGFREVPILLGGAGGYQPDDVTPEVWARMALAVAQPVDENRRCWVSFSEGFDYCKEPDYDEDEVA